jgi:hypothetical protein
VYARVGLVQGGTTSRTSLPDPLPISDSVLVEVVAEPSRMMLRPLNLIPPMDPVLVG